MTMPGTLLDQAQKALAEAKSFWDDRKGDGETLSAEDREAYAGMLDKAEEASAQYRLSRKADKMREELGVINEQVAETQALNEARLPESLRDEPVKGEQIRLAGLKRDFRFATELDIGRTRKYMSAIDDGMTKEELRLVIGTDNKGGYWTPDYWERMIVSEWRMIEGFSELISPMSTDHGNQIFIPTRVPAQVTSATVIADILRTETPSTGSPPASAQYRSDVEGIYGQTPLNVYKVMQQQSVSTELLEDSFINVAQEVGRTLGQWFGEFMEHCFTNGTGTSQPKGAWNGIAGTQEVNQATTGNPTIKDFHALTTGNPRLRGANAGYAFVTSRAVWGATVRAIDTNYLPWWGLNLTSEGRMMAFGYPVYYGMFVPTAVTANSNPVGFGLWNRYLRTRIVNSMRLTVSSIAESTSDEITYRARLRFGSCLLDTNRAVWLNVPS